MKRALVSFAVLVLGAVGVSATQPPTAEQIQRFRADGSLDRRIAAVRAVGNHRLSPVLAGRLGSDRATIDDGAPTGLKTLPSHGRQRVFALLVGFSDYPGSNPVSAIDRRLFGTGPAAEFPYESLRDYYRRSSFGALEIEGVTLGWYQTSYPQSGVQQSDLGREFLIKEIIEHFDAAGHDFSQYDNDGDGFIDYFLVFYAGPHQEWGDFWWGYQVRFQDSTYRVDGVGLGAYSWQWEAFEVGGPFTAGVAIHETGHALGLPDYYDYDDEIGPRGGLGGLDMMDAGWGDHNAFSKWVLGWIEPMVINEGGHELGLRPSHSSGEAVIAMHGDPVRDPYAEFFVIQNRWPSGNDFDYPTDGLLIWHIDARVDGNGRFLYDNSFTDHKLIRLMEADGFEEIEQNMGADAGDYYQPGRAFSDSTSPSAHRYDGLATGISVGAIERGIGTIDFELDLGSGCGLFTNVTDPVTGWPGITTPFRAAVDFANCDQAGTIDWIFSDGATRSGRVGDHAFDEVGTHGWQLTTAVDGMSLDFGGEIEVCDDARCRQWRPVAKMSGPRLQHAAVVLTDGRVLVVGGGVQPEIYDPATGLWRDAAVHQGTFAFASAVRLVDGRVLVTGSTSGEDVNAEVYDPVSDSWTETGRMAFDRVMHSSILLPDGRVLVAGGVFEGDGVAQAELYDPLTGSWSPGGGTGFEEVPGLALLDDGEVLYVAKKVTRIFDPVQEDWRRVSDLVFEHRFGATVTLPDGEILVIGGEGTSEVEAFDQTLNLWRPHPGLGGIRAVPSAAVLPSGHVIVTGGADGGWRIGPRVEVLDPATGSWVEAQPMAEPRLAHTCTALPDGSVLVTGGTTAVLTEPFVGQNTAERFLAPVQTTAPREGSGRLRP